MGKYHYKITPKRRRCKTMCVFTSNYVGSVTCRDKCESHEGYGVDDNGKYVECKLKQ